MSVSWISASLFSYISQQNQSTPEKLKQEFQQVYATMQQDLQPLGQVGSNLSLRSRAPRFR